MSTTVELLWEQQVARIRFRSENGIQLLTASVRDQLADALDELDQRDDCRVVVFEAEGRTFIAGADVNELDALNFATGERFAREGQKITNHVAGLKPVTIAAIHAVCAGGGCELALACDFRIASENARIGLPEVTLGLLPGWGGTVRAGRLFGPAVARQMILTGELFTAEEAYRLGIVDTVVPEAAFRDIVDGRVEQLLSRGPTACRIFKRLLADSEREELGRGLTAEAQAFGKCFAGGDPVEGLSAFLEKRPPRWDEPLP